MKTCRKCGTLFEGLRCKLCQKVGSAARAKLNIDRKREQNRVWREANSEKLRASLRKSSAKFALSPQGRGRSTKKAQVERLLFPERVRIRARAWRLANPEKVAAYKTVWRAANSQSIKDVQRLRQARKRANGGFLSKDIITRLLKLQRGLCACCRQPLENGYHLDHIIPLALGGANSDANVQLLTPLCNLQKSARHPVEFMQARGFLL